MEKLKNFLEKYKFLLIILTFISTVLLVKKDYLETVVFKSSVMKNDIDIYKENCNFDFEYLLIGSQNIVYSLSNKLITDKDDKTLELSSLVNKRFIKNEIYKEYIEFDGFLNNHSDVSNVCLYLLSIKQNGTVKARNVIVELDEIQTEKGFNSTKTSFLNSLHKSSKKKKYINIGDMNNISGVLIPIFFIYQTKETVEKEINSMNNLGEDYGLDFESFDKTNKTLLLPTKIFFINDLNNEKQYLNIRKMLDYSQFELINIATKG